MISNDRELAASIEKLSRLEAERDALSATEANPALHRSCSLSLSRLINQISEEVSRYRGGSARNVVAGRSLASAEEARNTRRKLQQVESLLREKSVGPHAGAAETSSLTALRRTRNELKEQLLRFEAKKHEDVRA
jgi:hypothetical protein